MAVWKAVNRLPAGAALEDVRVVRSYGGTRHDPRCPHAGSGKGCTLECVPRVEWNAGCSVEGETFVARSYRGKVFATRERNGYHDSDFYAVVWDEERETLDTVEYATTRFPTYENSASPDVEEDGPVHEAARGYLARMMAERMARALERERAAEAERANEVRRGDDVTVFKGRKVPVGTKARVFWLGPGHWGMRVGLETFEGERMFTALDNVRKDGEAAEPAPVTDEERAELARKAEAAAARMTPYDVGTNYAGAVTTMAFVA